MQIDAINPATAHQALATAKPVCSHCRQSVPAALFNAHTSEQFCCAGCRAAYAVIHGCGLERYYALREGSQLITANNKSARSFQEFDDPAFLALYATPVTASENWRSIELLLQGVHCSACVWLLEKLPRIAPNEGVCEARLDVRQATLTVTWDTTKIQLSEIARILDTLGYRPHPARGVKARDIRKTDDRAMLVRLGVAGAIASNVMLLALALYAGVFNDMDKSHVQLFRWVSMLLSVVSMFWPGFIFIRGALSSLRARMLTLDVPIAAGLLAGTVWGVINTVRGVGDIYFDSVSVLIFFLIVARFIQQRQQRAAADSVELLFSLTPSEAQLITETGTKSVPVETLRTGDVVLVLAGASVPVDGTIMVGESSVDRSLLTGESRPVRVSLGDHCEAGTVNIESPLRIKTEATGEQTRVGRLMKLVEEGSRSKAPTIQWTDKLAGHFIFVMLVVGLLTVVLWWMSLPTDGVGLTKGITNAVALLVVTCPCGLGLATPMVMTMAMGRAARTGILVKHAAAIELLAKPTNQPGTIFLDKTGTLTEGKSKVVEQWGSQDAMRRAAALERSSTHHVAAAIREAFTTDDTTHQVDQPREILGRGIEGVVDGINIRVERFNDAMERITRDNIAAPHEAIRAANAMLAKGLTPIAICESNSLVAFVGIGDSLRTDASDSVNKFRELGWQVRILSGDHHDVVSSVAKQLNIADTDAVASLTPEQKLAHVTQARQHGPVIMIGDGVNDAPALAAATVGIAVKGGAEASLAATDIYLTTPGLTGIRTTLEGAARTMRTIRICVLVSILYNIVAAALSITGIINPLLAAIIMPMASLSVLALALKSRTFPSPSLSDNRLTHVAPSPHPQEVLA
ncbi:MAG: heavy metal translocating P-type ATPase metal-binding domain-containing protein [Phycisphaerales bacterium]